MKRNIFTAISILLATTCVARGETPQQAARGILKQSEVRGGLIIHLGCGDGTLTAALRASGPYVVQGLEVDPAKVEQARAHIRSAGLYGPVSVIRWSGRHLPYAENLVNLIVGEVPGTVTLDEMLRVLTPRGVALVQKDGRWTKHVKPWPKEIDEWPHYLHGPDNNAVADDTAVGPPRHVQWICGPRYARSHEINSSLAAMVSAGGRLFYIWDEGLTGITDKRLPPRWSLLARDAFNGALLWKQPVPRWGWRQWHAESRWNNPRERARMLRTLPPTLPRRLVATAERLYVTLGYEAPVSILETATGAVLGEIAGTRWTDEILCDQDVLVLRVRVPESPPEKDAWEDMPRQTARVMAVGIRNGKILWQSKAEPIAPLTLATSHGKVFYCNYQQVVCLDRAGGRELWRSRPMEAKCGHRATCGTLVAREKVVLYAHHPIGKGTGLLKAYCTTTGKILWTGPAYTGPGVANPPDLFVANDLVWVGDTTLPPNYSQTEVRRQGFDLITGKVVREVSVPKLKSPGHHARCYRSKATERYLMLPKRGVEFLDLRGDDHMRHDWLRPSCIYGVVPANGILYVPPHQCVCYPGVLLSNFNALTAKQDSTSRKVMDPKDETRLVKGPAYWKNTAGAGIGNSNDSSPKKLLRTETTIAGSQRGPGKSRKTQGPRAALRPGYSPLVPNLELLNDWPTYRHDPQRSGRARTTVPDQPKPQWEVALTAPITPPVAAGGHVLVAEKDSHQVVALDVTQGRTLWRYTAGGRIDSPPTVHGELVLFGCADGWVYCLLASDGSEVWRFRAAPQERRVLVSGQLESAWPVHGSVLVQADATADQPRTVVYVTAGRSSLLDGGIHVYGLNPHTGELLHHTCLDGPHPNPFEDTGMAGYMDGAKSDILVSDGSDLYLFQERFTGNLTRIPAPMRNMMSQRGGDRIYPPFPERGASGRHLIATGGLLDDTYNEGTYWNYSARWPGWARHLSGVPGQILVFDEHTLFGVNVFTETVRVRRGFTPGKKGFRLFARKHGAKKDTWSEFIPVRVRAMVLAGKNLFVAGPPDVVPKDDPLAAFEGRKGGALWTVSAADGKIAARTQLDAPPAFDGLIAADGRLFLSTSDGRVLCFGTGEECRNQE